MELEIERVKRDLVGAEEELEAARRDLTKRDLEVAQMVGSLTSPFLPSTASLLSLHTCLLLEESFADEG